MRGGQRTCRTFFECFQDGEEVIAVEGCQRQAGADKDLQPTITLHFVNTVAHWFRDSVFT